jgi:PAS domain S-box-containing protein
MEKILIKFVKNNRDILVEEWLKICQRILVDNTGVDTKQYGKIGHTIISLFLESIEKNDFTDLICFTEDLLYSEDGESFSIVDTQLIMSSARNMLIEKFGKEYQGEELIRMIFQANHIFDHGIFHMFKFFQKIQEKGCQDYAAQLESQVQKRTYELEESRSNYQILFEKINDGCFVNQKGKIVFANKAFCQMHAYERDEIIGIECQNLIAEDSRDMVMERFYKDLKGENKSDTFIYCRQDKNGQRIPTENRIKLIKYKGRPAVLGLSTDITKRIELEEKIKQKDRLALIGRLTTSIAHEIRNPLSAIKVNIEILMDKLNLDGNDLRRLQIAHEQSVLLEDILSETLQFAKPIKLNYAMTDIDKVIDYAMEVFEEKIRAEGIVIRRKNDSDIDYIMADRARIIEAVANVVKNAIEAFDGENGKLKRVEITTQSIIIDAKKYLRLSVLDNGKGIKQNDRKGMFEPFVTKGKKGGVGLGLPIVKRIVDAHNGYFDIKSKVGEGTSFSFIIPAEITH